MLDILLGIGAVIALSVSFIYKRQTCNIPGTENSLEIIVIGQLLSSHNPAVTGEKGHARLASNSPFLHSAVGCARMVHETCNGSSSSVDDHVLVKVHEIVTLDTQTHHVRRVDHSCILTMNWCVPYLILLVRRPHPFLALRLGEDFSRIFDNHLVRFE